MNDISQAGREEKSKEALQNFLSNGFKRSDFSVYNFLQRAIHEGTIARGLQHEKCFYRTNNLHKYVQVEITNFQDFTKKIKPPEPPLLTVNSSTGMTQTIPLRKVTFCGKGGLTVLQTTISSEREYNVLLKVNMSLPNPPRFNSYFIESREKTEQYTEQFIKLYQIEGNVVLEDLRSLT
ncbi:uncharacterized protein LOC135119937 [Zophobas morio]|uniref:uncharacterized protein LOC135119937 n=1 Tax=Zophobas morio TaxID=2755281 RepID=UPI003083B7F8